MTKLPMILTTVHQEILLAIDGGMTVFQNSFPPAADLVAEGYCEWMGGNPMSWNLELTNFGVRAVCMIQHPEAVDDIRLEKIDETVCRIVDRDGLLGFAVKYGDDMWKPFDSSSRPLPSGTMSSPESVLLMFKMEQARIADECTQALDIQQLRMVG
ncbi:hypothetical protein OIU34_24060 [Pararhizobium sp. BT-229]|uniref:hypothetical protein n=1 Tax=Pararhizobium sp. BT-229 TaxID=2986923 RepID=UPI0021F7027F|nr:hypothetical protein [Pararhizobium sp. BT-229]MCV9964974.1 hypothetical protein [Pararhizobium sp. BT-229]